MSFNWERGVLVGIVIFFYLSAVDYFGADLNIFINALILTVLIGVTVQISKNIFEKDK